MFINGQLESAQFESIASGALPAAASNTYRVYYLSDLKTVVVSDGVTWNTLGAEILTADLKANGILRVDTIIDGKHYLPFDIDIVSIGVYIGDTGTSGSTTIDVVSIPTPGGAQTSVFTILPVFTSAAADDNYVDTGGITPPGAGVTAPVLNGATILAGSTFALNVSGIAASASNAGVTIHYRRV